MKESILDDWLKKEKTQAVSVRYAELPEPPRVNELRMMVSELHAEGRPDVFRVGFCEEFSTAFIKHSSLLMPM